MAAPIVLPMPENLPSAAGFAEKINHVNENKLQITKGILEEQQNLTVAKMNKEMFDLKHELKELKKSCSKRVGKKEPGRNSPQAKLTKVTLYRDYEIEIKQDDASSTTSSEAENTEPKRKGKSENTMAKRSENERINNLHRRYTAKMNEVKLNQLEMGTKTVKRQS